MIVSPYCVSSSAGMKRMKRSAPMPEKKKAKNMPITNIQKISAPPAQLRM